MDMLLNPSESQKICAKDALETNVFLLLKKIFSCFLVELYFFYYTESTDRKYNKVVSLLFMSTISRLVKEAYLVLNVSHTKYLGLLCSCQCESLGDSQIFCQNPHPFTKFVRILFSTIFN